MVQRLRSGISVEVLSDLSCKVFLSSFEGRGKDDTLEQENPHVAPSFRAEREVQSASS